MPRLRRRVVRCGRLACWRPMARRSAGILLYRRAGQEPEVLLVHPGGPFWARKDDGAWSIPKGEYGDDEEPRAAALREFEEELGTKAPGTQRACSTSARSSSAAARS